MILLYFPILSEDLKITLKYDINVRRLLTLIKYELVSQDLPSRKELSKLLKPVVRHMLEEWNLVEEISSFVSCLALDFSQDAYVVLTAQHRNLTSGLSYDGGVTALLLWVCGLESQLTEA